MPGDSGVTSQFAKSNRPKAAIALALLVGLFLGAAAVGSFAWAFARASGTGMLSRLWSGISGRTFQIDVSQPTVVDRIQKLQRLETVVYTMDKVVSGAKQSAVFPDFLAGDRILLLVHGDVVAGIDFSELKAGDVKVSGKEVRIHIPAPEIFSTRLDSAKTRVYSRQTGWLVPTDPNLETEARQQAEQMLQQDAQAGGILKNAQDNAQSAVRGLLQGLGFETVTFN
jgi:hypothetical protein